jgi:hypothetical protein
MRVSGPPGKNPPLPCRSVDALINTRVGHIDLGPCRGFARPTAGSLSPRPPISVVLTNLADLSAARQTNRTTSISLLPDQ